MTRHRVMAIGLDGFDYKLAERFMAEGHMPALADLKQRAARFFLDEGYTHRSGIPWESAGSGLSPQETGRWSPVVFDPATYTAWREGGQFAPWWDKADLRAVVFDAPNIDLRHARNTQGVVAWGTHSPGTAKAGRPGALLGEVKQRFGDYPAGEWMYGVPWPSARGAEMMGKSLSRALDVRSRAAGWLATERFPEWDFFFAMASELHGGMEGLWHGVDAGHPLHTHPSAGSAASALLEIHRALDRMIGQLVKAAGDAVFIAFNLGGMGPNRHDTQSMVLLPELLYRHAFGHSLLTIPPLWAESPDRLPIMDEHETWDGLSGSWVPEPKAAAENLRVAARRLPRPVKAVLKRARAAVAGWNARDSPLREDIGYMPCYHYRHHWPRMAAFAVPSFGDGRIRINLRGRERDGVVEMSRYGETCRTIETLLGECRNPRTGEPAVARVERLAPADPLALPASEADLLVVWRDVAAVIEHPRLGLVGPVPLRRTGGHTPDGIAYIAMPGLEPGDRGVHSSFDVVPTIARLLGVETAVRLDGKSLL
jgi:predicted AlkP superfamily phosphohydrolase/phosphomutase